MPDLPIVATVLGALALAALLVAEARAAPVAKAIAKTVASAAFVAVALARGATGELWSVALLSGLGLSMVGDLLLLSHALFLAGLFAFLGGHLAYVAAFALRGLDLTGALLATPLLIAALVVVARWLLPHVKGAMRGPVLVYMAVISVMVIAAASTVQHRPAWSLAIGATAFYLSDLAVARERFVAPGFVNRAWGLPVYYAAQLLLAWSI